MTWQILLDCGISELPINLNTICKHVGVRVINYIQGRSLIRELGKSREAKRSDGFIMRFDDGSAIIFYNSACSIGRQRFTIAHELGHLLLGHHGDLINREPSPGDNPIER
ncbi:MAG: ImmA/IrrE family metallo-endopeptidase, partial [Bacillota bacterium]